jgi:hypothetical protein
MKSWTRQSDITVNGVGVVGNFLNRMRLLAIGKPIAAEKNAKSNESVRASRNGLRRILVISAAGTVG